MTQLTKQKALAVVVAATLLAAGVFWTLSRSDTLGEMKLLVSTGTVTIERGGETVPVSRGAQADIAPGDLVTTDGGAQAILRLEGGRRLLLDEQTRVEILGPAAIDSVEGTIVAAAGDPMKVTAGDTVATGEKSRFRIDRDAGTTRAGVYKGRVDLSAPGSPNLRLDALWQATVVADRLYGSEPYQLRHGDRWDGEFLDYLVDLDRELASLRSGYIGQISGAPTLAYFDTLVKGDAGFMRRYVRRLSPKKPGYTADVMINFFLAKHADGRLDRNFDRGLEYFRDGASWGVAAGLLGFGSEDEWKPALNDLRVAILGTSGLAGGSGSGEGPSFAVAGDGAATDGGSVDGAPVDTAPDGDAGDGTGDGDTAPPPDGDDPDDPDDPDPTETPDPSPPPCDLQCEVDKILQPSPDPTKLPAPIGN